MAASLYVELRRECVDCREWRNVNFTRYLRCSEELCVRIYVLAICTMTWLRQPFRMTVLCCLSPQTPNATLQNPHLRARAKIP